MGLTDKAVFSYAIKNCIIFSLPPDDLDVNELKCSSRRYHKFDQCEDQDDAELVQLCDNQLGWSCLIYMNRMCACLCVRGMLFVRVCMVC